MTPEYTIIRCRKDDTLYGPVHGANDLESTLCGVEIDENWWILSHREDSKNVTCKKCLREMTK